MDTDFIIPSENDKNAVLDQIDGLHEEHRLKILRDLATKYNDSLSGIAHCEKRIDLDKYGNNASDLIFSLWARKVKIPQGMAFGDPYDDIFEEYSNAPEKESNKIEDLWPCILLRHASLLPFFLMSATKFYGEGVGRIYEINKCIECLRRKDGSQWPHMMKRLEFRAFLLNKELTDFNLVYLALSFHKNHFFYDNFALNDLYYYDAGTIYRLEVYTHHSHCCGDH